MLSLVEIALEVFEKKISKVVNCKIFSLCRYYLPIKKDKAFAQGCFFPSLVETVPCVSEEVVNVFFTISLLSPAIR